MRIWCNTYKDTKRVASYTHMTDYSMSELLSDIDTLSEILCECAREFDYERPVVTKKHYSELGKFGRTTFLPTDFIDIDNAKRFFDKFVIEFIPDSEKGK